MMHDDLKFSPPNVLEELCWLRKQGGQGEDNSPTLPPSSQHQLRRKTVIHVTTC